MLLSWIDFLRVLTPIQLAPALALSATCAWGVSDFIGGFASRRANAFLLTTITHVSGTTLMTLLALRTHAEFPGRHSVLWAAIAGLFGGVALATFYRALAMGNMGLTAPVAAVLGAAIPAVFGIVTQGMPGARPIIGFVLAGAGIWLISRTEGAAGTPRGIGAAVLAGLGFAAYYLSIHQAGDGNIFWLAGISRSASFVVTGAIVLVAAQFRPIDRTGVLLAVVAGLVDISGTALFIRSSQMGRLDSAVVISSLYPVITVLMARIFLKEHFSRWRFVGLVASLVAVPMIAWVAVP
jgi:drug/metabolite transporter (DMT)-like permease